MQHSDAIQGASSSENKRPNILRRKTAYQSSKVAVSSTPLLSSTHINKPQKVSDEGEKNEIGDLWGPIEPKPFTKKRKPTPRIILDTYVCDRYRAAQQVALTEPSIVTSEPLDPLTVIKDDPQTLLLQNDLLPEEIFTFDIDIDLGVSEEILGHDVVDEEFQLENPLQLAPALAEDSVGVEESSEGLEVAGEEELLGSARRLWLCSIDGCNKLYSDRSTLHAHMLTHFDDTESYVCEVEGCGELFTNAADLQQHQQEAHPPRQLVTAALASVGVTEDQIYSFLLPDGRRCWLCPNDDCELTFKTQYLLRNHILSHYDLRPFKCGHPGCDWAFRSIGKLRTHLTVHTRGALHACPVPDCCKTFSTKYNLQAHARAHERGPAPACPVPACPLSFSSCVALEAHLTADHSPHQAAHRCSICGKRFWWKSELAAHARAHARVHANSPSEFMCAWPGCGRRFPHPCRLRYHQRSHTGDKPYRCTFPSCNWAFTSASKLRRHARAHAGIGERRHVCTACGQAFLRAEHLREHLPRHHPHRHHRCDHPGCEEKFSNKSSVYVHKKREHGADSGNKPAKTRRAKPKDPSNEISGLSMLPQVQICEDELLSLRSARTHVPWAPCASRDSQSHLVSHDTVLLQHHSGCDESKGNPLVCGGLGLEPDGSGGAVLGLGGEGSSSATLGLGGEGSGGSLPELGPDLLGPSSMLLQEELSDGMLYAAEEETALQVLLLNEDPGP